MSKTNRDIAEYQTDHDLLVTLNVQMVNMATQLQNVIDSHKVLTNDHEIRIRALEQRIWIIAGATAAVSVAMPFLIPAIFHLG